MKKKYNYILYLCILGICFSCQNTEEKNDIIENENSIIKIGDLAGEPVIETNADNLLLIVSTQKALVRAEAKLNSAVIANFSKNDTLKFANRVSEKTFSMRLEGIDYDEPWLKIFLPQDSLGIEQTAWIYGGNVNFINLQDKQLEELILDRRIRTIFGEDFVRQYHSFKAKNEYVSTDLAFELAWRTCEDFSENLELRLLDILEQQRKNTDTIANFYWLNDLFGGAAYLHWYKEHDRYYIWKDLRFWADLSLKSVENTDDAFVETQLKLYQPDSIEFFQAQTSFYVDGKSFCTLGTGVYEDIFIFIGAQLQNDTIFKDYYKTIVQNLLSEIVNNNYYWRPLSEVKRELEAIIKYAPVELFSKSELLILDNRLKELNEPNNQAIHANILETGF